MLIVEEALETGTGHWSGYIGDIATRLRIAGDVVDVAVHREATSRVVAQTGGTPWFSRNCWTDLKSQGAVGGIRHNLIFRSELSKWLCNHQPYDWICALTMRVQHLLAFALLSKTTAIPSTTRFFLLFVQGFGRYVGNEKSTQFPNNASTKLAGFCFRLMAPSVRSGRVVLAAETEGMQEELHRFTGLPVTLAPHPVKFTQSLTPSNSGTTPSNVPLTITCPGFARHEKGTDLFQEAILMLLTRADTDRFHFVLQWTDPYSMPDGSLVGPDATLLADPRVEFLNKNLSEEAYEALLTRTDLIILPYRRKSYHHRVSRVAIEAAGRGIPIIYTKGTWSGEIASLVGCGVPIRDESAKEVAAAILKAADQILELRSGAVAGAQRVIDFHSVATLRALLADKKF